MKKIIVLTIGIIVNCSFLIVPCQGQSVNELLGVAVKENTELKILENEYLAALEKAPQVNERPDPEIGIGIFPLPVETRLGPQIFRVGATQMFPWKGLLDGKKNLELAKAKALFEKISAATLEIRFQIEQAYFKLYEIEKRQIILSRNLTILESLEQLALAKVESGKTTAVDVLRVQLKTKELLQEIKILNQEIIKPTTTINQLLRRNLATPIQVIESLEFANIMLEKETLLEIIESNHPMLKMFELQQAVSQQTISINKLSAKPSFGVGLDYIMVNKRNDAEPIRNGRDIVQLRGTMKIPLYKNKYEAKEKEENLKIKTLDLQKENLLSRFSETIEKGFVDYETAKLKMELYEEQIDITKSAIRILETNYSVKGSGFDELIRMEQDLIEYDLKILKAIVQSHLAKSSIERFVIK